MSTTPLKKHQLQPIHSYEEIGHLNRTSSIKKKNPIHFYSNTIPQLLTNFSLANKETSQEMKASKWDENLRTFKNHTTLFFSHIN